MIGIYKITSPSGKIYIGQSVNIEKREKQYKQLNNCSQQIALYASLVKYGFSEHIFEVMEECKVEELNTRERHWQDFYNVTSSEGLNCYLTKTDVQSKVYSKETIDKISTSNIAFNKTIKGIEKRERHSAYLVNFYKTPEGLRIKQEAIAKIDYKARAVKAVASTDFALRTKNTDYKARTANTDYVLIGEKHRKPILQYEKDGTFIREWSSGKEAGTTLGIYPANISACIRGKSKSTGGFIWKYK